MTEKQKVAMAAAAARLGRTSPVAKAMNHKEVANYTIDRNGTLVQIQFVRTR